MATLDAFLREHREALREQDPRYSVRQVARRVGVQPSYLSKVEREEVGPPSEETLVRIAAELNVDPDLLLAVAGKVSRVVAQQQLLERSPLGSDHGCQPCCSRGRPVVPATGFAPLPNYVSVYTQMTY